MNKENLIPIEYSREITPFYLGDVLKHSSGQVFELEQQNQVDDFNDGEFLDGNCDLNYSVVSFAARPSTGKQPVGDDVMVSYATEKVSIDYLRPVIAGDLCWHINLTSWKPDHAAMLAKYQSEQREVNEGSNENKLWQIIGQGDNYQLVDYKFKEQGANEMYTAENTAAATAAKIWPGANPEAPYILKFFNFSGDNSLWLNNGKWEKFFTPLGEPNDDSINFLHRPAHEEEAAHTDDNGEVTYALTYKLDTFTVLATHFSRVTDLHYRTMPGEFASVLVVTHIDEYDNKPTDWAWVVSDMTTNSELIHNIKGEFWSLNGTFANRSDEVEVVDGERVEPTSEQQENMGPLAMMPSFSPLDFGAIPDKAFNKSLSAIRTLKMLGYSDNGGQLWKPPIGKAPDFITSDKPAFTQAMADAGELPPVGSKVLLTCDGIFDKNLKEGDEVLIGGHADFGGCSVAVFCKERGSNTGTGISSMFKPIDNRTDDQKIIAELLEIWEDATGRTEIFQAIIASDKFTIKLLN